MNLCVGIAGAGMIVAHHMPAWHAQAAVTVVGIADPDRARADARADAFGTIRGIAVTSAQRLPQLPDLPTVQEAGLAGFETQNWFGVFAPARTPAPIIERLAADVRRTVADPDCRRRLTEMGVEPVGSGPVEFTAFWDRELATWGPIVRASGATVE